MPDEVLTPRKVDREFRNASRINHDNYWFYRGTHNHWQYPWSDSGRRFCLAVGLGCAKGFFTLKLWPVPRHGPQEEK